MFATHFDCESKTSLGKLVTLRIRCCLRVMHHGPSESAAAAQMLAAAIYKCIIGHMLPRQQLQLPLCFGLL